MFDEKLFPKRTGPPTLAADWSTAGKTAPSARPVHRLARTLFELLAIVTGLLDKSVRAEAGKEVSVLRRPMGIVLA